LRELVTAGVLEKQPYRAPGQRTRREYVLSRAGHDLMPVVLGLLQWGGAHSPKGGGVVVANDGCGAEVRTVVRCAAGHDVDETDVVIAPAGRPGRDRFLNRPQDEMRRPAPSQIEAGRSPDCVRRKPTSPSPFAFVESDEPLFFQPQGRRSLENLIQVLARVVDTNRRDGA
jgi:hypothetical protein